MQTQIRPIKQIINNATAIRLINYKKRMCRTTLLNLNFTTNNLVPIGKTALVSCKCQPSNFLMVAISSEVRSDAMGWL